MANSYETMYVVRPDLSEERVNQVVDKYVQFITERGATGIKIQNRGKRRLAYEIQNFQDGIYIQMNYNSDGQHIKLMERDMRLSEEVIRYLNLKLTAEDTPSEESPVDSASVASPQEPPQEQPPQEQPAVEPPQEEQPTQEEPTAATTPEQPPEEQPAPVEPTEEQPPQG